MDDGLHMDKTILNTIAALRPHLAKPFVYFIEDNATTVIPHFGSIERDGLLAVVSS